MLITVVSFIVVLGFLVFFHELGHYWVARRNGIVVEEFGMGYPPRLVKLFTYDGTDFTINLIPFGGFAKMRGEDQGGMEPGTFNAASRGGRAATLIAGPAMNAILAVILFAISFIDGFPAPAATPQIIGEPSAELSSLGFESGDLLITFNDEPLYISGNTQLDYQITNSAAENTLGSGENVVTVGRNGNTIEIVVPSSVTPERLLAGEGFVGALTTKVSNVAPDSPADKAQLQPGDTFYRVDGQVITTEVPLTQIIDQKAGEEIPVVLLREGEWIEKSIRPRLPSEVPENEGKLGVRIESVSQIASLGILSAIRQGFIWTMDYFLVVLQLPFLIFSGEVSSDEAQLTGPVGIASMVGGAVNATLDTGFRFPIWQLSAILSAALAVTNMLPLPALDGGRLLFILIETIRGRRINPEREGMVHMVGFMLLLGLIVLITVQDISSPSEGIDWISILGQ